MRLIFIFFCICFSLNAAKLSFSKIDQAKFDEIVRDCEQDSKSDRCFFAGFEILFKEQNRSIYSGVEFDFIHEFNKEDGLKMLEKACFYDKKKKIEAIASKQKPEEINADPMACYTLFSMYETFGDTSEYHKNYIKAMQPYYSDFKDVDFYTLTHSANVVKKDLKTALKYYKHMCYEQDLQMQCAKYYGFLDKLKRLCKKGYKYACGY